MATVLPQLPRPIGVGRRRTDPAHQERYVTKNLSPGASPTETRHEGVRRPNQSIDESDESIRQGKQERKHITQAAEPEILEIEVVPRRSELKKLNEGSPDEDDAPEEDATRGQSSNDHFGQGKEQETVLKLSPARLYELTSSPKWLPLRRSIEELDARVIGDRMEGRETWTVSDTLSGRSPMLERAKDRSQSTSVVATPTSVMQENPFVSSSHGSKDLEHVQRPHPSARTTSTPLLRRRLSSSKDTSSSKAHHTSSRRPSKVIPLPLRFDEGKTSSRMSTVEDPEPSPMPQTIPIPPLSLPTYLQLELSSQRPSPLYIHRSVTSDFPYESSRVKIDRLKNFLFLPPQLEQILWFGALACLDCWLYSFTILPLRFFKALSVLFHSWGQSIAQEARFIVGFIYSGTGRMWTRTKRRESLNGSTAFGDSAPMKISVGVAKTGGHFQEGSESDVAAQHERRSRGPKSFIHAHRRTKSVPSALSADDKADILKGFLILISCVILMYFDASRMYHGIRGQAAIKLYVIYNVLEVCDKLFSAIGQDVLECLFSKEALERKADGRSKVWRPFWLFILALCYNLIHSTALFYQVITLNVAVNSYSNALLTLLMSNQFVEIKSTVFKKFEKENLFQLTCADVVERFQLWLMLLIIASRNIIETGGLSLGSSSGNPGQVSASTSTQQASSILPKSFTMFPEWTGQVLGPFILVLGSEMLVDWLKHAYITKFNNTKPAIYGRFLDVLAKDYYSNAFAEPNLTRRLGLPVIPLSCLFIRASVQTYHMFVATHMPLPLPSTATSISLESATASPATTAALQHIDQIFRRALGRSTFGAGDPTLAPTATGFWSLDDIIAFVTMAVLFILLFFILLAFKLVLGMVLLSFARSRYKGMKVREMTSVHAEGRRVGGWGVVEVDEDKRRWIYQDDPAGARKLREKEREIAEREKRVAKEGGESFSGVSRYSMIAKRIW